MNNMKEPTQYIPRYEIRVNGQIAKQNIFSLSQALAHAKRYTGDMFGKRRVQIINYYTGEITEVS